MDLYEHLMTQAYPGEYPEAHNRMCTGAAMVNTLGYRSNLIGKYCDMDAVYKMKCTFPHKEGDAVLTFKPRAWKLWIMKAGESPTSRRCGIDSWGPAAVHESRLI